MSEKDAQQEVASLEKPLNDAAGKMAGLWVSFVTFATLLIVTVGSVSHKQLFLEGALKLPLLNVDLPLKGFFVLSPLFFLVFQFYAFLQLHGLARKAAHYDDRLRIAYPAPEERQRARHRLDGFVGLQMIAGLRERRAGLIGQSNRFVMWITMVALPVFTLLLMQLRFLPYHHETITWLHRGSVLTILGLAWFFWPRMVPPVAAGSRMREARSASSAQLFWHCWRVARGTWVGVVLKEALGGQLVERLSKRSATLPRYAAIAATAAISLFSVMVAAYPSETIYRVTGPLTDTAFGALYDPKTKAVILPAPLFGMPLANRLNLPDADFGVAQLLKDLRDRSDEDGATLILRERDLVGIVLDRTDLRKADFTAANLQYASLVGAGIQGTRFHCKDYDQRQGCADLRWAALVDVHGQSAILCGADLSDADLSDSHFQGACLKGARLDHANLKDSHFQGAKLDDAILANANLEGARFQGASMRLRVLSGEIELTDRSKKRKKTKFKATDLRVAQHFGLSCFVEDEKKPCSESLSSDVLFYPRIDLIRGTFNSKLIDYQESLACEMYKLACGEDQEVARGLLFNYASRIDLNLKLYKKADQDWDCPGAASLSRYQNRQLQAWIDGLFKDANLPVRQLDSEETCDE